MFPTSSDRLVIRDYPILMWVIGAGFMLAGLFVAPRPGGLIFGAVAFLVGAVLALYLASVTTIAGDKMLGTLVIRHRSLLRSQVKEVPLSEIASIRLDTSRTHHHHGRRSTSFRLVLVTTSDEKIPLEGYYTSGLLAFFDQEKKARKLREFLGLPASEATIPAAIEAARQQVASRTTQPQQEGATDGVSWRVETITHGKSPVTRWLSPDFKLEGQFLYLTQKPKGSANTFGGLLGAMSNLAYRAMLAMYGFGPDDTPGLDTAQPVASSDPQLDQYFMTLTNDPYTARQLLTPWVVSPLVQWAEQHPMAQVQVARPDRPAQLVVLFSPQGVYAACFAAASPEHIDALTRLGVELVRAQGVVEG
jgi:hypothetical protein